MPSPRSVLVATALAALVAGPSLAQDFRAPLAARKGLMQNLALNLGILGNMAKGEVAYDATAAQAAADNLEVLSGLNLTAYFPEGSDNMSIENTRALPAIWDEPSKVPEQWALFGERAAALKAVAGTGQAALGPAIGGVGQVCGSCHEVHQAPRN